jgi:hypothetical protein
MWENILTYELGLYMIKVTGQTEDDESVYNYFKFIQNRIEDVNIVKALARQWKSYDTMKQTSLSIRYAGMYNASRFIIMMDYLANKAEKGEL